MIRLRFWGIQNYNSNKEPLWNNMGNYFGFYIAKSQAWPFRHKSRFDRRPQEPRPSSQKPCMRHPTWRIMCSYKQGYKSPNMGYNYSYPISCLEDHGDLVNNSEYLSQGF